MVTLRGLLFVLGCEIITGPLGGLFYLPASATQTKEAEVKRVAIIGAGAAGSSTAYHLKKFAAESDVPIEITVFERSFHAGGRSTTVDAYGEPGNPIELGASIFVEVNTILQNATKQFGLKARDDDTDNAEILGIWDGERFVYTQEGSSWWNIAKLLWKYGLAPIRTQRLMKSVVSKFTKLYKAPFFPFKSLSDRTMDLDLAHVTSMTGEQFLAANSIGPPFTTDIIQASTRVNYGQNLFLIHGLETMVCMAIEGAMQIEGGNWQIFDRMLNASDATVYLNTTVSEIKRVKEQYRFATKSLGSSQLGSAGPFDRVVLAAPFQYSELKLEDGFLEHTPDVIPYVTLHVTLFTSTRTLNPLFFGLGKDAKMPTTILTTLKPGEYPPQQPSSGVGPAGFWSISTLRTVVNPKTLEKEHVYKIFSPHAITADFLSNILGSPIPEHLNTINIESGDAISWYYPHVWKSYPYEYPRVTFEEIELAKGFYYTSGIESFISTMETSALMGMNVAQLLVDDLTGLDRDALLGSPTVLMEQLKDEEL